MINKHIMLFAVILGLELASLPTIAGQEKSSLFILCHDKKLLLVRDHLKVAIAECPELDWFAELEVSESRRKNSSRELGVLRALNNNPTKSFKPEPFEQSDFAIMSNKAASEQRVTLPLSNLPVQLRDFIKGTHEVNNYFGYAVR